MKVIASLGFVAMATAQSPVPVAAAVTGKVRVRTTSKPASTYGQVEFTTGEAVLGATGTKSVTGALGGTYGDLQLAPGSPDYMGGAAFWGNGMSSSVPVVVAQTWEAPAAAAWNTWETSAPVYQAPAEIYQPVWNNWEWETHAQPAWNTWEAPAEIYQPVWEVDTWSAPVDIYQPAWEWSAPVDIYQAPVDEWWNAAPAATEWSDNSWSDNSWSDNSWSDISWSDNSWNTEWSAPVTEWTLPATTEWSAPVTEWNSWSAPAVSIYEPAVNTWALPSGGVGLVGTASGNVRVRTTSKPASAYGQVAFTTGEAVLSATGTRSVTGALGGAYGDLQLAPGSPDYVGGAAFWGSRR